MSGQLPMALPSNSYHRNRYNQASVGDLIINITFLAGLLIGRTDSIVVVPVAWQDAGTFAGTWVASYLVVTKIPA